MTSTVNVLMRCGGLILATLATGSALTRVAAFAGGAGPTEPGARWPELFRPTVVDMLLALFGLLVRWFYSS